MRFAVIGSDGMLGSDITSELIARNIPVAALTLNDFDVADAKATSKVLHKVLHKRERSIVINCAAFTNVDLAETERDAAFMVNSFGAKNVALACEAVGAVCVYISTDYVFDGKKEMPYLEYDEAKPLNAYGASKLQGEIKTIECASKSIVARTSWLFGKNGKNFVKTIAEAAKHKKQLNVVSDQIGAPTYTKDLANALIDVSLMNIDGVVHLTSSGCCSWYEFAQEICRLTSPEPIDVKPVLSSERPSAAARPLNSRLANTRTQNSCSLPHWKSGLERYVNELTN